MNEHKCCEHKGLKIGGLIVLALAVVGVIAVFPDIKRYVRMMRM